MSIPKGGENRLSLAVMQDLDKWLSLQPRLENRIRLIGTCNKMGIPHQFEKLVRDFLWSFFKKQIYEFHTVPRL